MADKSYCYPGSNVLINKLGVRDLDKLIEVERRLTALRLLELIDHPIEGRFDFNHLQHIHRYIFQDIYDWAGEIRTVDIAKTNMFCNVKFIDSQAAEIFERLKVEHYLEGADLENMAHRLAYYMSEINALHPFREGNGRSQREFIRTLALRNGYALDFANASSDEMLEASTKSFLCDYGPMGALMRRCLRKL